MNATITAPVRPNLDIEAQARRDCRHNLVGLTCRHGKRLRLIRSTEWNADSRLTVYLDGDREPTLAADVTLCSTWPTSCCRSRLTLDGLPKRSRGKEVR